MTTQQATLQSQPLRLRAILGWPAAALVLGGVATLAGVSFFYVLLTIAFLIIAGSVVTRYPSQVMVVSIWALALCPFSLGIETGVLPKLFADEMVLLLYLLILFPMYWASSDRIWQPGFAKYFWVLLIFSLCQCLSLMVGTDLIAFRNLLETYILGPMLLVVFLQEAANTDRDELFANSLIWLAVVIAVLSVIERIAQRNPILERMELESGYQYLSPQIVAITEGVYRPYVTFFHPSETAVFMAMGLPYAVRNWARQRTWVPVLQILLLAAGLGVNATRGVWVAAAVALLLLAKHPIRILITAIPVAGLGSFFAYLALQSTPFMQRLSDLNNLLGRFIYWQLGAEVFLDHQILGVGHMQFAKVYLDYVHNLSELAQISLTQIYVIDNIYLTTLVEHGIVGLIALIVFFVFTGIMLKSLRQKLVQAGLTQQATLVQAAQLVLVVYAVSGMFADVNQFTKVTKLFFILVGFSLGAGTRSLRRYERENADGGARVSSRSEIAV